MASEARMVYLKVDPALSAYVEWINARDQGFDLQAFDLFAAGYRARVAEEALRAASSATTDQEV